MLTKAQREKILSLTKEINKKQGDGAIYHLGSEFANLPIPRWSTGIEDFDNIIGGGMPKGRMVEIYGPESSGKTSLAYHLCSLHEMCLYIPAEGTFDAHRARQFGNKPKQMLVYRSCTYAEDIMNKVMKFARAGIPLIVIDSVAMMVTRDTYEKKEDDAENKEKIGELARMFSTTLKPLNDIIEVTGTTVIFINQVRDKMDAMLFGEKTQTPGGRALRHMMSLRMQVGRKSWIEIPNKGHTSNTASNVKIGMIMKGKIIKSKVSEPFGEIEIPMMFENGFVSHEDVLNIRKETMKNNRFKKQGDDDVD